MREGLRGRLRGASGRLGIAALAGSRIGTLTRRTRAEPLSLPKSRFERTDDVGRQGSDGQQRLRSARSTACGARPSRAKHGSASRYNRWRTSQGFVEGAPRLTQSNDPCTRAGPIRSSVQYVRSARASGTKSAVSETSDFLGHQRARIAIELTRPRSSPARMDEFPASTLQRGSLQTKPALQTAKPKTCAWHTP
jgi:hypothetical protein